MDANGDLFRQREFYRKVNSDVRKQTFEIYQPIEWVILFDNRFWTSQYD